MKRGRLFVFEGGYSTGKTAQSKLFHGYLFEKQTPTVKSATPTPMPILLREPGGTPLGEKIRELLLSDVERTPCADLFLFNAARAELVETKIKPALEAGHDVVLDRFWPSSLVYQGILGRVGLRQAEVACAMATEGLDPDLVFWIDLEPEEARRRTAQRPDGHRFHRPSAEAVREAYEVVMACMDRPVIHVEALGEADEVHLNIVGEYEQWLGDARERLNDSGDKNDICDPDPSDA